MTLTSAPAPADASGRRLFSRRWLTLFPALTALGALACGADGTAPVVSPPDPPDMPPLSAFARVLDSIRVANDLPSLAGAIVTADSISQLAAVGFRLVGDTRRVTSDDRYHLGSVLKHQTSILVARLAEQGQLGWDRPLGEYFPDDSAAMRPEYRRTTLRHLLSHTTGLPRDPSPGTFPSGGREARLAVLRSVTTLAPTSPPGTYNYSNTGYIVAGAIVERVTGRAFEDVMRDELWLPLGMTTAGWGAAGSSAIDQPLGHVVNTNGVRTAVWPQTPGADNPEAYAPAGRAHMSIGDWSRFTMALLRAESGRDTPVLTSTGWKALTVGFVPTSGSASYGYGLGVTTRAWGGGRVLSHDGSNTRNYAVVWIAPLRNAAFLLATNQWSSTVGSQLDGAAGRLITFWTAGR